TAQRVVERRISVMTRALGSQKIPQRRAWERKLGNRYASSRLLGLVEVDIEKSCQTSACLQTPQSQSWCGFQPYTASKNTHTLTRRSFFLRALNLFRFRIWCLEFGHLNLFRISDFVLRACLFYSLASSA